MNGCLALQTEGRKSGYVLALACGIQWRVQELLLQHATSHHPHGGFDRRLLSLQALSLKCSFPLLFLLALRAFSHPSSLD